MTEPAGIYARRFDILDGWVQLGVAQGRVISVDVPGSEPADADDHPLLDRIEGYLEGVREDFDDISVALTVPTGQRAVLETVRTIPYGEEASVEQLARMVSEMDPSDENVARDIRQALADNPVPIFVPTHRVRDGPSGLPPDVEQRLRSLEGL